MENSKLDFRHHCCWSSSLHPTQCQGSLNAVGRCHLKAHSPTSLQLVLIIWRYRLSCQRGAPYDFSVWPELPYHMMAEFRPQKIMQHPAHHSGGSHRILRIFKGSGNRPHLLIESSKILEESVGIEISLWPFWEKAICHTPHGASFIGHHFWIPGLFLPVHFHYPQILPLNKHFFIIGANPEKTESTHFFIIMQNHLVLFVSLSPFPALPLTLTFIT